MDNSQCSNRSAAQAQVVTPTLDVQFPHERNHHTRHLCNYNKLKRSKDHESEPMKIGFMVEGPGLVVLFGELGPSRPSCAHSPYHFTPRTSLDPIIPPE